jgi:CheY-like chemotaxis protein
MYAGATAAQVRREMTRSFAQLGEKQMDGVEATKRIRALEAERGRGSTLVFGLTGSVSQADIERYKEAKMDGVIAKGNLIQQAVTKALDEHQRDPHTFVVALLDVKKGT